MFFDRIAILRHQHGFLMKKKVSIKDIAKQLGISISTVSFVVNGKAKEKRISDELTKRVLQLVDELDYKPDALARSFRTGKTNIIGFLVDDISEPFFSGIARFIDEKASKKGYKIIYSSTRNNRKKAVELLQIFQAGMWMAILLHYQKVQRMKFRH